MLEPYKGKIYDPCCGSGGMFVQSIKFIEAHKGNKKDISIYGQEYTTTTYKLAKMNLAIRGISTNLGDVPADTFFKDQHKDLKADFIMANPPLTFKHVNKIKAVEFSKKFTALIEKYNERKEEDVLVSEVLEDFTDEIIDLYHALKKEKDSFADLGIDFEEKAFYDILKAIALKYDFSYPEEKLIPLAREVKIVVDDKSKYTDWNMREDIKAELKVDLILLLAKHGYPPITKDEVFKEIFEQAENFKKFRQS